MIENIDRQIFIFLNSQNSPFWDDFMYAMSMKLVWVPLYLAILIYLIFKYKRKFLILLPFMILAVALSDQLSVLIKNSVERLRPCHDACLEGLVHIVRCHCGGLYGFVSSHASNSFNVAVLSLLLIEKRWYAITILIWASLVSYSRIYIGVHYPGDILAGAVLGGIIGWITYKGFSMTQKRFEA
ncbi:MAG TPA: phosphatase PAP2 family protein [Bacteroidales bacterium]|jgi:undecaprenyl-diphosphatase|nr:phosphatase PAP2 family protein [Bacteroidales bacterium]HNR41948.1 phosphatase PAP2 family protein [Bacteroidales bacterium]HQG77063.1 phosphatase PAP2 family protein [Bacteroidales bacterium]